MSPRSTRLASDPAKRMPALGQLVRYATRAVLLGVAANLAFAALTAGDASWYLLSRFDPRWMILAVGLTTVPWFTNAFRLKIWSEFLGRPLALRSALRIVMGTELASAITPTALGGGTLKAALLLEHGHSAGGTASLLLLSTIVNGLVFALLIPIGLLIAGPIDVPALRQGTVAALARLDQGGVVVAVALALGVVAWRLRRRFRPRDRESGLRTRPMRWLRRVSADFLAAYRLIGRDGKLRFAICLLLAAFQWGCRYSVITALLVALGVSVDPIHSWILQWVVFTLAALIPTPGAVVGAEASLYAVYGALIPGHLLGIATVGWRFLTFYMLLLIDLVSFPLLDSGNQKPTVAAPRRAPASRFVATGPPDRQSS